MVDALVAVPIQNGAYQGRLASWFDDTLMPTLVRTAPAVTASGSKVLSPDPEAAVIAAWSGPADRPRTSLEWEGQRYVLDPAAAEEQRLGAIRRRIASAMGLARRPTSFTGPTQEGHPERHAQASRVARAWARPPCAELTAASAAATASRAWPNSSPDTAPASAPCRR